MTKKCVCRKANRSCTKSCHFKNTDHCRNEIGSNAASGDLSTAVESVPADSPESSAGTEVKRQQQKKPKRKAGKATKTEPSIKIKCLNEEFDSHKHADKWHDNSDFHLVIKHTNIKICGGCIEKFHKSDTRFVIKHREPKFSPQRKWSALQRCNVYYHCCASCIVPRHPYFKPSEVKCDKKTKRQLSKDDLERFKQFGIDLLHLTTTESN